MLRTLFLTLVSVGLWIGGSTASVHATIHAAEGSPEFYRMSQERLQLRSVDVERGGRMLEPPLSFSAPTDDATKAPQEHCLWDIAVAPGCQPLPGSPFSAFPVVFSPDLFRH